MAEKFAAVYHTLPWTAVFSSSLQRSVATAKPLCEMTGLALQMRDSLLEIAYGQWEGKSPEAVNREFHDDYVCWLADPGWNCPIGGEKGIDVARRSSRFLEEVEYLYPSGHVLVVSHKSTIRIMLCSLLGVDVGRYRDRFAMPVCALTVVELARNGPFVHFMGDRSHLPVDLRELPGT